MPRALIFTTKFKKDLDRIRRQGKDVEKLFAITDLLQEEQPLPDKLKDHALIGRWKNHRECHIEPDWLFIYLLTPVEVIAQRTGSHAELFGK